MTKKEIAAAEETARMIGFELWAKVRRLSTACAQELRFYRVYNIFPVSSCWVSRFPCEKAECRCPG